MNLKFSKSKIKKDNSANQLAESFTSLSDKIDFGLANLYYKYPFYNNENKDIKLRADFLAITQKKDVHIFSCLNKFRTADINEIEHNLNFLYQIIDSQLRKKTILKKNRTDLEFKIYTHIFCEDTEISKISNDILVFSSKNELREFFEQIEENNVDENIFRTITSVIEGIDESIPSKDRNATKPKSRGTILSKIENSIINYDNEQFVAITTNVNGFQRIRGLAGTGKTIILARKVAELHRDNPDKKILYTYYTKALNEIVVKHINRLYKKFSGGKSPNWDMIDVIHSWGGSRLEGVYYKMCSANGITPLTFREAKLKDPKHPFEYVCKNLLEYKPLKKFYDYILIDEGQDFRESFYRLCHNVVKDNNIIWAYDDFQDILKTNLQDEKSLFGKDEKGEYYVDFENMENPSDHDIILKKCYRNSKDILTSAFSLGMGVYNKIDDSKIGTNCVQRIESNKGWEDIGFEVEIGKSTEGEEMLISRPLENSPDYKEEHLSNNLIEIKVCENIEEECKVIAEKIENDIYNEELLPEDICVICLDNLAINDYFSTLIQYLNEKKINTFNLQKTFNTNINFTKKDCVTLSTIYKAKGNESGSIYILGVDSIFKSSDDVYERNKLFTAVTRSKGWVYITGTGKKTKKCEKELLILKENQQKLHFYQPSGAHIRTIKQRSGKIVKKKDLISKNLRDLASELNMSVEEYVKEFILKQ